MSILVKLPTLLLEGRFKLTVLDKQGRTVRKTGWRPNLITDAGLDRVLNSNSGILGPQLAVGTGNAPPSHSDISLSNQVAAVGASSGVGGGLRTSTEYWVRQTFTFPLGSINNHNITELGIRHTATPATLMTRALVTDESGNPTSITVTSQESLVVTYEVRSRPDKTVLTGSFPVDYYEGPTFIETVVHDFVAQANGFGRSFVPTSDGSSGLLNSRVYGQSVSDLRAAESNSPPGQNTADSASGPNDAVATSISILPRDGASMYRDTTFVLGTGVANFASGIGQVKFWNGNLNAGPWWGIYITPKIPKTSNHTFSITVRNSVGRA